MSEFTVPPFRPISDFIGEGARFSAPDIRDVDKWANRVLNNLIFYQTNYMVVFGIIFLIVGMFNPAQLVVGMITTTSTVALLNYVGHRQAVLAGLTRRRPGLCLTVALIGAYLITALIGSVLVYLFGIALPILVIFIHASLRLRNLMSKVFNRAERMGAIKTPMGFILEQLGETFEQLGVN